MKDKARSHSMAIGLLLLAVAGSMQVPSETTAAAPLTLHVAVDGDDEAAGTLGEPLQSLPAAQQRVRAHLARESATDVVIILHEGVYYLTRPLRFTSADNPAENHTITWQAAEGAHVRISGGRVIDKWEQRDDGALVATLNEVAAGEWSFRELFVNGERRPRARYPSTGYARVAQVGEDRRTNFTFHAADIPESLNGDLRDADLELVFFHEWSISRTPVASIDQARGRLVTSHPVGPLVLDFFVMDHWVPDPRYYLENHPALLTSPGQWYLDRENGKLTYLPVEGESAELIEVVAPVADGLIEVRGEPDSPVRGLIFRGLHFEHAGWSLPECGYHGMQATFHDRRDGDEFWWRWRVPAALSFELAEHCMVENGSVRRIGMAGIELGSRTSHNRIAGNFVDDIAANGIMIGETNHRRIDGESWTRSNPEQAAKGNVIEDNIIQRVGMQFFGAVGIWVGLAADTEIRHNTIRQTPCIGISVGWQWTSDPTPCRGTKVEANHIHDVMQLLSDGGGIYTLGWQPNAVFRENLIHDVPTSHGRAENNGIFMDEGSKGLRIEDNIIYAVGHSPLRFNRADRIDVHRNTFVLPDEQTPLFRRNATQEESIDAVDNQIRTSKTFDAVKVNDLRKRVGPRINIVNEP